jgi:hypothetical protein
MQPPLQILSKHGFPGYPQPFPPVENTTKAGLVCSGIATRQKDQKRLWKTETCKIRQEILPRFSTETASGLSNEYLSIQRVKRLKMPEKRRKTLMQNSVGFFTFEFSTESRTSPVCVFEWVFIHSQIDRAEIA